MTGWLFTRERLAEDLRRLGVEAGDTLFVQSSFKSLGPVEGGAGAVIGALEDAVGPEGHVLMPSFNLVEGDRAANWNPATTPATTGYLTEYFRAMPGTVRSEHYSHSVAARGRKAQWYVEGHLLSEGMSSPWDRPPWGRTYGDHSPMVRALNDPRGKVLMLGVDYHPSTYCHIIETICWNRALCQNPQAEFYYLNRLTVGAFWDALGRLKRGRVGQANCRLFSIKDFVDTCLAAVEADPPRFFKSYPGQAIEARPAESRLS